MLVFKAKLCEAMVIAWEAIDQGEQLPLVNQGEVNSGRHRVITTMFYKINVIIFHVVQ